MTARSPVVAILWEVFRVTRAEAFWRLALSTLGGALVLAAFAAFAPEQDDVHPFGAAVALFILILPTLVPWLSLAKLTAGRPGYPFTLLYTQPLRTPVLVGVQMAYLTAASAAIYIVGALVLRTTSGYAFPLMLAAAWIAGLRVVLVTVSWSTRSLVVWVLCVMAAVRAWPRLTPGVFNDAIDWQDAASVWPPLFGSTFVDYAFISATALAAFAVTVTAVNRERHGSSQSSIRWSGAGFRDRLLNQFRFACPISSPMRAQVWFELRKSLPLLAIGVTLAIVNLLLSVVSGPIDAVVNARFRQYLHCLRPECYYARPSAMILAMTSVPIILMLGNNAFGLFSRQGGRHVSPFQTTLPLGTGRLAATKVLMRAGCVLVALTLVGASMRVALVGAGDIFGDPLRGVQRALRSTVDALSGYELLAVAVILAAGIAMLVTSYAVFGVLRMRYPRRLNIAGAIALLYGIGLVLVTLVAQRWYLPLDAILRGILWGALSALLCVTVYLVWRTFVERLLSPYQAAGIVLLSAIFAAAWLTLLHAGGMSLNDMTAGNAVRMLSPALLPLMMGVVVPWAYSRVRHT